MGRAGHKWSALGIISISLALRQDFPGFGSVPFQVVWTAAGISGRVFHPKSYGRAGGFLDFPLIFSHFLPFQTAGLPRSVGQGLEFRKPGHLRTFPDICLNQDLPDFGIFRMRPNHAARATTRVAPYVTPLSRCQGNHKGCPYGITWLTRSEGHFGHLGRRTEWPWRRVRRDVVLHRYYGRGLLSEMGRGKCQ